MDISEPGYKFHMNDIAATMGLVGMRHSDELLTYRKSLCEYYAKKIIRARKVYGGAYWMFGLITDRRDELMDYLRENNVECDLVHLRNDIFKVFGGKRYYLPHMNELESKYLYLPLHTQMSLKDIDYIAKVLNKW